MRLPTRVVLQRVLRMRCDENTASGFVLHENGRQFVVTAKHLLSGTPLGADAEFRVDGKWCALEPKAAAELDDVAVLESGAPLVPQLDIEFRNVTYTLGTDVMLLGYPLNIEGGGEEYNLGRPLPIVKRGNLCKVGDSGDRLLIDAVGNPGLSGGPIVCERPTASNPTAMAVLGVISQRMKYEGFVFAEPVSTVAAVIDAMHAQEDELR